MLAYCKSHCSFCLLVIIGHDVVKPKRVDGQRLLPTTEQHTNNTWENFKSIFPRAVRDGHALAHTMESIKTMLFSSALSLCERGNHNLSNPSWKRKFSAFAQYECRDWLKRCEKPRTLACKGYQNHSYSSCVKNVTVFAQYEFVIRT